MSNNTSYYQEYTFPKLLEQYDKILIPMIQRDYAQGRTDKKATDVRNNLLNDIFSDNDVHFDLVFGSKEKRIIDGKEMNCFIPVDGQQRLTTLFLLFLYGLKAGKTNIELDLSKFSYDTRRAASDFCKSITSEEWTVQKDKKVYDVIKDSSWFMNYWEKDPTVEGMLNMLDAIHEKYKEITDYPNLDNVTFFFFDLESNGLNENLYLKMNSRGKPLTAFENLKAEMEKILPENVEFEDKSFPNCDASPKDSFKAKWKYFMDRNWTEAFWDSANPSKYDVNIAKFIVRFLSGYWAAFGQEPTEKIKGKTISENLKEINKKEKDDKNYADYIQFEPIEKVLKLVNAFPAFAYALTIAPTIEPYWKNDTIKVSDTSEYKILSVIFTYTLFDGDESAMRFAWNMAENYVSEYDNFVTYCKRAGEIGIYKRNNNLSFYQALSSIKFDGNTSDQMEEEIAKAKQILDENETLRKYEGSCKKEDDSDYQTWEEIIIDAEKYAFFNGAIRFLFTQKDIGDDWDDFDTKWNNAQKYFDENGVKNDIKVLLTKSLVIQCNNWNKQLYDKQIFNPNARTWKWILTVRTWIVPIHNILRASNINDIGATNEKNDENVKKFITPIIKDLPFNYFINNEPNGRFRWFGPRLCFYKPYGRDMATLDWENWHRNKILSSLLGSITTGTRMGDSNFFWGWNINFKYKDHFFQWYGNPNEKERDVYLMENDWADYKKRPNPLSDKGTDEDKYYCFRVTEEMESDTSLFTKALDLLID